MESEKNMSKKTKKTTTDSEFYNDANRLCDALRAALDYIQEPCGRTSAEDHEIQDNALDAIAVHDRLLQKAKTITIKLTPEPREWYWWLPPGASIPNLSKEKPTQPGCLVYIIRGPI